MTLMGCIGILYMPLSTRSLLRSWMVHLVVATKPAGIAEDEAPGAGSGVPLANKPSTGSKSTCRPLLAIIVATLMLPLFSRLGGSIESKRRFLEGRGFPRQQSPMIARHSELTTTCVFYGS